MQKKLIALAVAGLVSGAAFAQTNVTVYGSMDFGYAYLKSEDNKFSGIEGGQRNGNRVGFRGTEALGNGLNAVFQAEFGFKGDIQGGLNTTRNSWLGLQHAKYGTVMAGRQNSVAYDWISKGLSSDVTVVYPSNQLQGNFSQLHTSDRVDNALKYVSPNWNGFTVATSYGFGEKMGVVKSVNAANGTTSTNSDTSDAGRWQIGANYNNGPIDVVAIYSMISKDDSLLTKAGASADNGSSSWSLGGSYDFKVVKLFAQYQREHNELATGSSVYLATPAAPVAPVAGGKVSDAYKTGTAYSTQDDKRTLWSVGATIPVTQAGKVIVEYVNLKVDPAAAGVVTGKATGWGLGYEHQFSKRTVGYAAISHTNYDDFNGTNTTGGKTSFKEVLFDSNSSINAFGIGVRHAF